MLVEQHLLDEVSIWADAAARVRNQFGDLPDESRRYYTIRQIIDDQVIDVVQTAELAIQAAQVASPDDVRRCESPLIRYSPERREKNLKLRKYLYKNLYYNPAVAVPNQRAAHQLREVFDRYWLMPHEMDPISFARVDAIGIDRAVCDCVASMTDRFCVQEYQRMCVEKVEKARNP